MRRSTVLGIAVVAAIAVVGMRALASRGDSTEATDTSSPIETPTTHLDARFVTTDEHGVSHGWARDAGGATNAAVAAVRLTGPIAQAGFITRSDMIASLASERYGPTLASESANQLAEMTAVLGQASVAPGDLVWSELPLTARVVEVGNDAAQVDVWSVLVIGVVDLGAPRQAWRTVTIELIWESGDWKVDGWRAEPGPTPMLDATTAIATTKQINEVVAWPPVGGD